MTLEELQGLFEKHDAEFLKFNRVENKVSERPDLQAFLLLDSLDPGDRDAVACAEHDEIWLAYDAEKVAQIASEEQIVLHGPRLLQDVRLGYRSLIVQE